MRALLRIFFHFLYHPFAFAYDLVAAAVSFGHWKDWVMEVVPFIEGTRTLEIGHGPGHLHRFILRRSLGAVAMDESASMSRLARRRLISANGRDASPPSSPQSGYAHTNLARGLAQRLPFRDGAFETVIATFPAEYITDPRTLSEVKRCLSDGGRFVVLPVALPKNRLLSWLFRVTGQAPGDALQVIQQKLREPFVESEFDVEMHVLERNSGTLIVIVATARAAVPGGSPTAGDGDGSIK
jgi:ubiquinone/menaquinone biosynthesis C-methylase UbiE